MAKLRGHEVTIFEERELGGLLHEASVPEFKADIRPLTKYLITQVEKLGIPVEHKHADAAALAGYDAVICATGSRPVLPKVPGIEKSSVVTALDVLDGCRKAEGKIVVIGGGLVGTETALDLAEQGSDVTLVEMLPQIMNDVATTDRSVYGERIAKTGMEVLTGTRLEEICDGSVTVSGRKGSRSIPADTVIIATGLKAQNGLYEELIGAGKEAYLVGDAIHPGKIFDAFHTAYRTALKI